jgi:hypothetical protein
MITTQNSNFSYLWNIKNNVIGKKYIKIDDKNVIIKVIIKY